MYPLLCVCSTLNICVYPLLCGCLTHNICMYPCITGPLYVPMLLGDMPWASAHTRIT
jgi:hypothetical protein